MYIHRIYMTWKVREAAKKMNGQTVKQGEEEGPFDENIGVSGLKTCLGIFPLDPPNSLPKYQTIYVRGYIKITKDSFQPHNYIYLIDHIKDGVRGYIKITQDSFQPHNYIYLIDHIKDTRHT